MLALVTGGASCGKSAWAEQLATSWAGPHCYLAAMKPFGRDAERRIARHRELRAGKGFSTVECCDGIRPALEGSGPVAGTALLECLGNVVANELFADDGSVVPYDDALRAVLEGVELLIASFDNLVVVGNEVGSDGVRYEGDTQAYIRILGAASCAIAARADLVVECVAGFPLAIKGEIGDSIT